MYTITTTTTAATTTTVSTFVPARPVFPYVYSPHLTAENYIKGKKKGEKERGLNDHASPNPVAMSINGGEKRDKRKKKMMMRVGRGRKKKKKKKKCVKRSNTGRVWCTRCLSGERRGG